MLEITEEVSMNFRAYMYLLHHTNGQMHVYLVASSIKIEEPAMIPNHTDVSRNQVEVTREIYVILESGIKLPLLFL